MLGVSSNVSSSDADANEGKPARESTLWTFRAQGTWTDCSSLFSLADEDDYEDEEDVPSPAGKISSSVEADDAPASGIASNLQVEIISSSLTSPSNGLAIRRSVLSSAHSRFPPQSINYIPLPSCRISLRQQGFPAPWMIHHETIFYFALHLSIVGHSMGCWPVKLRRRSSNPRMVQASFGEAVDAAKDGLDKAKEAGLGLLSKAQGLISGSSKPSAAEELWNRSLHWRPIVSFQN